MLTIDLCLPHPSLSSPISRMSFFFLTPYFHPTQAPGRLASGRCCGVPGRAPALPPRLAAVPERPQRKDPARRAYRRRWSHGMLCCVISHFLPVFLNTRVFLILFRCLCIFVSVASYIISPTCLFIIFRFFEHCALVNIRLYVHELNNTLTQIWISQLISSYPNITYFPLHSQQHSHVFCISDAGSWQVHYSGGAVPARGPVWGADSRGWR